MRVAVVGANLLGSASAVYIRRALDANATSDPSSAEPDAPPASEPTQPITSPSTPDDIVVFEKQHRAGGAKFSTLTLGDTTVPAGTASGVDVAASPPLSTLLRDAAIDLPPRRPRREWAVFDWNRDEYKVAQVRSRFLSFASRTFIVAELIQVFALLSAMFFARLLLANGVRATFVAIDRDDDPFVDVRLIVWFAAAVMLGAGVVPVRYIFRFYGWIFFRNAVSITANMTYGGVSLSVMGELMSQFREQLQVVLEQDSATSCITLGHLLSACGMAKYARVSTPEFMGKYQVRQEALDDLVSPGINQAYANSACGADSNTNALACLLNMLTRCPMPVSFRNRARYFDAEETKALCPKLIDAAGAKLRLGVEVRSVMKVSKTEYELFGTDSSGEGKVTSLGYFDAVVLAAVIDPERFTTDVADYALDQFLALDPTLSGIPLGEVQILNTSKHVSLVRGELNTSYFKKSSTSALATHVTVRNSVNCSELLQVGDDAYRVGSGEEPERGSNVLKTIFKEGVEMVSTIRKKRTYYPSAMKNLNGAESPAFIIGTRFLNAAFVDRVASDVSLDCLSARNTASFFRDGVATWK